MPVAVSPAFDDFAVGVWTPDLLTVRTSGTSAAALVSSPASDNRVLAIASSTAWSFQPSHWLIQTLRYGAAALFQN